MSGATDHHRLELLSRMPAERAGRFLIQADRLFLTAGDRLLVASLADPGRPEVMAGIRFRAQLTDLVRAQDVLFVGERGRSVNLIDVSDAGRPDYFDCLVLLGLPVDRLAQVAGKLIVSLASHEQLALYDLADPRRPHELARLDLGDGVEDLAIADETIWVANDDRGLVRVELKGGGLAETGRWLEDEGFQPQKVFAGADRLYLYGYGDDEDRDLWILDRRDPARIIAAVESDTSTPRALMEVGGRALYYHSHYTCSLVEPDGTVRKLFRQYETDGDKRYLETTEGHDLEESCSCMDDIEHWLVQADRLYASQGDEFLVYRIREGSELLGRAG
jgi:hypothetical protein